MRSIRLIARHSWRALAVCGGLLLPACDAPAETGENIELGELRAGLATGMASASSDGQYFKRVLTTGSEFHATNGIYFGPDRMLYVASVLHRSIAVVDPSSGKVLDRIGPERGVESPDDLVFGPDGSLYWTSFFTGEVGRLTPSGEKRTVARLGQGVNAITFSADGRLFVTRVFMGDELYELDPEGVSAPRLVASMLGGLNAMAFGPDGHLYGPLWFRGQVARVDVDTGVVSTVLSGLGTPAAVKFDSAGRLHVVDQSRGEILRADLASGETTVVGRVDEAGADNLAFDAEDHIFITNSHDGYVREILPNASTRELVSGGLVAPGGVAVLTGAEGDSVFVADALSMRELDGNTGKQLSVAHSVIGVSPLATPLTVASDGDHLITTSWFGKAVQVVDPVTHAVLETHRDFVVPMNAIRFQGSLVVAELGTHQVVSRRPGTSERVPLAIGLPIPVGLAATEDDLFVSEWLSGRVLQVVADGTTLPTPRIVASGLSRPEGLAIDRDGSLLVVETGLQRLVRIEVASGKTTVVDEGLALGLPGVPGLPPPYLFNGVSVGGCGSIYVTLDRTNQLMELAPRGAGEPGCFARR